jgi:hypothetical protein
VVVAIRLAKVVVEKEVAAAAAAAVVVAAVAAAVVVVVVVVAIRLVVFRRGSVSKSFCRYLRGVVPLRCIISIGGRT